MTVGTSTTTNIRAPLKRPKVSFSLDREMSSVERDVNDPLPIVELKPFVNKVWRREKSLPSFYDRSDSVCGVAGSGTASRSKEIFETVSEEDPSEEVPISPPPRTAHSLPATLPSQRMIQLVSAFHDIKTNKDHFNKFVVESGFRPKSRIHPPAESVNKKQPVHVVSVIPGFITRDDREKSTIVEITDGDSYSRAYSCSPKAIGPEEIRRQQQIKVKGQPINQSFDKKQYEFTTPSPTRSFAGSWNSTGIRHGSPASMLYFDKTKKEQSVKRTKTPLYDIIDRKGVLPSLQINAKSLKTRHSKNYDPPISEDYNDYREAYEDNLKQTIGGIENSFKVLTHHGKPTKVERQLSFELEQSLSRYRKSKDYSPFEINPAEIAKLYVPPAFNLTQGEMMIRNGLNSNTSQRRRSSFRNKGIHGYKSNIPGVSINSNNRFTNGLLRRNYDKLGKENTIVENGKHFDATKNSSDRPSERAQTNMTFTTDEELMVPHDTPRSQIESRISMLKQSEPIPEEVTNTKTGNIKIQKDAATITEKVPKDQSEMKGELKGMANSCDYSNGPESNERKEKAQESVDSEEQTDVKQSESVEGTQKDASGRTFITSDNVLLTENK